jgi:hypothetical protein
MGSRPAPDNNKQKRSVGTTQVVDCTSIMSGSSSTKPPRASAPKPSSAKTKLVTVTASTGQQQPMKTKRTFGSNWAQLKSKVTPPPSKKPRRYDFHPEKALSAEQSQEKEAPENEGQSLNGFTIPVCSDKRLEDKMRRLVVGLDCEMVGLGDNGRMNALARCSLVDFDGHVVYDTFVQPKGFVTDFRTKYSGVRKGSIRKDQAVTLEEVTHCP